MNTMQEPTATRGSSPPIHWHFRAMPTDAQCGVIRRLALTGLDDDDIAAKTGLSLELVRRVIQEDECLRDAPSVRVATRRFRRLNSLTI